MPEEPKPDVSRLSQIHLKSRLESSWLSCVWLSPERAKCNAGYFISNIFAAIRKSFPGTEDRSNHKLAIHADTVRPYMARLVQTCCHENLIQMTPCLPIHRIWHPRTVSFRGCQKAVDRTIIQNARRTFRGSSKYFGRFQSGDVAIGFWGLDDETSKMYSTERGLHWIMFDVVISSNRYLLAVSICCWQFCHQEWMVTQGFCKLRSR
jgi:hypothetical protein